MASDTPTKQDTVALNGTAELLSVVARLRAPDGCPWDREQTLASLKQYLVEETYELIDAIDSTDPDKHREELGDVLLQVVLQAQIRAEEGRFDFDAVSRAIAAKLIHRHPHVFGDVKVADSAEVLRNWETNKTRETGAAPRSVIAGIPRHLPSLQKAQRIQSRAARVGFDWQSTADVVAKIQEELDETREALASRDPIASKAEIGDLLFSVVNLCRFVDVQAEEALELTIAKFARRFQAIERQVQAQGRLMKDCTLAELDGLWNAIKQNEKDDPASRSSDTPPPSEAN